MIGLGLAVLLVERKPALARRVADGSAILDPARAVARGPLDGLAGAVVRRFVAARDRAGFGATASSRVARGPRFAARERVVRTAANGV